MLYQQELTPNFCGCQVRELDLLNGSTWYGPITVTMATWFLKAGYHTLVAGWNAVSPISRLGPFVYLIIWCLTHSGCFLVGIHT